MQKTIIQDNLLHSVPIEIKTGKKLGGDAIPYGYYETEKGTRLRLDNENTEDEIENVLSNKKYAKHCLSLITNPNEIKNNAKIAVLHALKSLNQQK